MARTTVGLTFPVDGDVLNRHDGAETEGGLNVLVRGVVPEGGPVHVNGIEATIQGNAFSCEIALRSKRNTIVAETPDAKHEVRVAWNQGSRKRYRFSMDDNIQFLKDFGQNPQQFPSLFDHWYLAFLREMHEEYGTNVHINIYYQTDGFDLTQMPDKWKDEWRANAAWLHLSFHALQDKPDRPYRNATYTQVAHDYDLVCGHIRRFAGNEVLSRTTTVHWAECPKEGVLALRDRGIETLVGLFAPADTPCTTGYYLPPKQREHCLNRTAWHDNETGVTFVHCPMVVNAYEVEAIEPALDARAAASPHAAEMMELLIHEQYFRQDIPQLYQPTVLEKVKAALQWVTRNGYEPVFWSDGFLGAG